MKKEKDNVIDITELRPGITPSVVAKHVERNTGVETLYQEALGASTKPEGETSDGTLSKEESRSNFVQHREYKQLVDDMKRRFGRIRDKLETVGLLELIALQAEAKALRALIYELENRKVGGRNAGKQQTGRIPEIRRNPSAG